jgi:hypothetical protein
VKKFMKRKQFGKWAISMLIIGLMITVSVSASIQTTESENQILSITKLGKSVANLEQSQAKSLETIKRDTNTFDSTPLFLGYTPTVASDTSNVALGFQDDQTVWFTGSTDGGITWPENAIGYQIEEIPEFPDVDSCGDGRFLGGMVPNYLDNDGSALYKWEITDVSDFDTPGYSLLYWTWNDVGEGYTDFVDVAAGAYTSPDADENLWAFGAHSMQGDHGGEGPEPMFSYQSNEAGSGWIYHWGGEINGGESTSTDIDPEDLHCYVVWNYYDDDLGQYDILLDVFDFSVWEEFGNSQIHPEVGGWLLSTNGNDEKIDISAQNDNIIIVSENDGQILAYYNDDGFNSGEIGVAVIDESGEAPRIVHTDDNTATCVFVRNGDVYSCSTDDGGITWTNPSSQSGSEDAIYADVAGLGFSYEADDTVYYGIGSAEFPIIGIGEVSGGIGVTVEITNTGTGDAIDLPVTVQASGGMLGMIDKQVDETITVTAEGSATVSLPMIIGFGQVVIEVNAGSVSETFQGTQLLIFTML